MEKVNELKAEINELRVRVVEAEETLNAIRSGEVDALVSSGPNGDQIFTLQGAETPYRILVEEMNQGALMIVPDGTIFYANTRFSSLSKTPLEQVIGSSWQHFFPRERHSELEACLKVKEPSMPWSELKLQAGDGSFCPVHLSLRSMSNSGVKGFSVIVTDLTERQKSENALRKTSEELLEKNAELEAFSNSISHDMRAPLRAMQQYAHVIMEDYGAAMEEEPKSFLNLIISAADRLDRLVLDVLAYSQLSAPHHEMNIFDLDQIVTGLVDSLPGLREAQIEVVPSFAQVCGFEVPLGQCISNLLGNAIKFVPIGVKPKIKVWAETAHGWVRLWVQDNGIGISTADQEKIFTVFTRLHSNDTYEGTGLGLSIVKKAVEKMGGQVGVQSELGCGSRFWIELKSANP